MKKFIKTIVFLTAFMFAVGFSGQTFASAKANKGNGKAKVKKEAFQKKVEKENDKSMNGKGHKYAKGKEKKKLPPVIKQGRLLLPVNAITKSLGAEVSWNQEEGKVTIVKDGVEIVINLDTMVAVIGGEEFKLDEITDKNTNGRIVPIGFIAEKLGVKLDDLDEIDDVEDDDTDDKDDSADDSTQENPNPEAPADDTTQPTDDTTQPTDDTTQPTDDTTQPTDGQTPPVDDTQSDIIK